MADDKTSPSTDTKAEASSETQADTVKKDAKTDSKSAPLMRVRVSSPFKVFFDQDAYSITGSNATGEFDILPYHHNFISLLSEGELAVKTLTGTTTRIRISGGIMHVKADQVIVFLNV